MNALAFLDELHNAGIRLKRDGGDLIAEIQRDAMLDGYREQIRSSKPLLVSILEMQEQIVVAATVDPTLFDRVAYDELWARWQALQAQELAPCGLSGSSFAAA